MLPDNVEFEIVTTAPSARIPPESSTVAVLSEIVDPEMVKLVSAVADRVMLAMPPARGDELPEIVLSMIVRFASPANVEPERAKLLMPPPCRLQCCP